MTVDAATGCATVRVGGDVWRETGGALRNVRHLSVAQAGGRSVEYEADAGSSQGPGASVRVRVTLADHGPSITFEMDVADRGAEVPPFELPGPFVPDGPRPLLVLPAHGEGLLLPSDDAKWAGYTCSAFGGLDMPWFGVTDMGRGYIGTIETPDDCLLRLSECRTRAGAAIIPHPVWLPSKRRFRYPRKVTYHFVRDGGYVELAKLFRTHAEEQGWVRTLSQKRRMNPSVTRLLGAAHIWGATMSFCREARSQGIEKAVVNGRFSPSEVRELTDMGWLVGERDNYADLRGGAGLIADECVKAPDGNCVRVPPGLDGEGREYQRCSALAKGIAELLIPPILRERPYNTWFCDSTTAEGLVECYDPQHGQARSEDRASRIALLETLRRFRLVVGGEHGTFWAVPVLDYQEGMMSGGPAPPDTTGDRVSGHDVQYGTGTYYRVPLWELVFHDCVVSTWARDDGNGRFDDATPEISDRKDALNVLYGTPPLMLASRPGYRWARDVELPAGPAGRMLQTYRNTCLWHEQVACERMLSHESLNKARTLQRTTLSGGYAALVNFGEDMQSVEVAGARYRLGRDDFVAYGPRSLQYRTSAPGGRVTFISTPDDVYADPAGQPHDFGLVETSRPTTIRAMGDDRLRVDVEGGGSCVLRPAQLRRQWDPRTTRLFALDSRGERVREVAWPARPVIGPEQTKKVKMPEQVELQCSGDEALEVAWGNAAHGPDLAIAPEDIRFSPRAPREPLQVRVTVRNLGDLAARAAAIVLYADGESRYGRVAEQQISLAPGESRELAFQVPPGRLGHMVSQAPPPAGWQQAWGPWRPRTHVVIIVADAAVRINELVEQNNRAGRQIPEPGAPGM